MQKKERNAAVDALKGLMIILIILHHSQLLPFLHHGYLGVDVFFMIAGFYLMQHYSRKKGSAVSYTLQRIKGVYLPYLLALVLACILDYKRLISFDGFEGFIETYAPFTAFLTLTEELGFVFHTPVILVGGWFLSVLIIGGFLLYGLLEFNERLTIRVILPFSILLGFTFYFSQSATAESFSILGAVSFPLLRGFLEMGTGMLLNAFIREQEGLLRRESVWVMLLSIAALVLFGLMVLAEKPLDGFLIIVIPLLLLGVLAPDSRLKKAYDRCPTKVLAGLGALSLEAYLIHQPVLHIVHSCFTHSSLPIRPAFILPADLIAVILAAFLLRLACGWIKRPAKKLQDA